MRSGDGLLVRIRARAGAFSIARLRTIASVAARFGSGEIDLTSRGNLQLRGILDETYEATLSELDAAALIDQSSAAEAVRNVVVDALSGVDPSRANVRNPALALEDVLVRDPRLWSLPGKFGFSFSGNAAPRVGGRAADIMITSEGDRFAVCLDGAADVVCDVPRNEIIEAAQHLALVFLELRKNDLSFGRMRDSVARIGAAPIFAMAGLRAKSSLPALAEASLAPVGMLGQEGEVFGVGIGLTFGRIVADQLDALCDAASAAELDDVHTSPERVLVFPVRDRERGAALLEAASSIGLITMASDARLAMDVCPGAPACGNASTATRNDALRLAKAFSGSMRGYSWHVSGCEKGCARRGNADFTLVARRGHYDVIAHGGPGDPVAIAGVEPDGVASAIVRFIAEHAS
jgi:precorrin-3B synthase